MHPSLEHVDHRPWRLPETPWNWRQSWLDLLFAHWPIPASTLQPLVPEGLKVQEFEGTSWIGVVPFRMEGVMLRNIPDVPGISDFLELNLRIYVEHEGRPGVWFFSLDASNPPAVWAARTFFHLPYFQARMSILQEGRDLFHYRSKRTMGGQELDVSYEPIGDVYAAKPGTLEYWLTERYMLYAASPSGDLYEAQIHHAPWPLQPAQAEFRTNQLTEPLGFPLEGEPALLHFSRRIDVIVWSLQQVASPQPPSA